VIVRLADRTHAGRVGRQSLNARAFSPLAHICAQRPSLRLAARDPQPCWLRNAPSLPTGHFAWSRCRTTRSGRPPRRLGVARPFGASTGGASPPPVTGTGVPENAGAFSDWRLPRLQLARLGPVQPQVLCPGCACIPPCALRAFSGWNY
jgi:hypothetical protein